MNEFEKKIVIFINQHRSTKLDVFNSFATSIPSLVIFWIAVGFFLIFTDLFLGIEICFGLAIVFVLHVIISDGILKKGGELVSLKRVRPYKAYPSEIEAVGKNFSDPSFPSSHVAAMTGGLSIILHFYGFLWPLALIAIVFLGWSRIRNGMHYPSDVLAGIILGLFYSYLALAILGGV